MSSVLRVDQIQTQNGTPVMSFSNDGSALLNKFKLPVWTISTRPNLPEIGLMGFNSENSKIELWNGVEWSSTSLSFTPNLVTSGLVTYIDSGNINSYPGSGTTVNDLSGTGTTGTLVNGVGYNSSENGYFVFDGTNDYINFSTGTVVTGSDSRTVSMWIYINSGATGRQLLHHTGNPGTNNSVFDFEANSYQSGISNGYGIHWWGNGRKFSGSSETRYGVWHQVTCTHAGGNLGAGTKLYINGSFIGDLSAINISFNTSNSSVHRIGYRTWDNSLGLNGRMSQYLYYNRELSASEVLQNYDAIKSRYGLS